MSDTMNVEELPTLIGMLHNEWLKGLAIVEAADEKLVTDGGAAALSRKLAGNLPAGENDKIVSTIADYFANRPVEDVVALVYLFRTAMSEQTKAAKEYLDANKTQTAELDEAVINQVRDERKEGVKACNALRIAVQTTNPAWALMVEDEQVKMNLDRFFPEQVNKRGAGPRAKSPRLKGSFIWTVDDDAVEGEKVADVAKAIGVTVGDFKTALLTWMSEHNIEFDFNDPPKFFNFELIHGDANDPDGHTIYKIRATRKDSDPEDDTDDDDEESFEEPDEGDDIFQ
jgi:hypothetical protein